jgi:hypothetical protein
MCQSGILPLELSTDERHEQRKESIPHPLAERSELLHLADVVFGQYHGVEGFRTLSHAKGIFEQG